MGIFFIAEIGLNHNGDIELAKEMVDTAIESGANAVKFQSINYKTLITEKASKSEIDSFGFKGVKTLEDFWKKVSIDDNFHFEIKGYCDKKGIEFISTPFDGISTDLLDAMGVEKFKVASGDLTHYPLIEHIASKGKPIILSTGMATIDEIQDVVGFCKNCGVKDLTLLHCLSLYPTPPELANLQAIPYLKNKFKVPVGFSDHTIGSHVSIAAIALGATVIEKHFTIDNNLPGPDQKLSASPEVFKKIVGEGNEIFSAIQQKGKVVSQAELEMREFARRSIVTSVDIEKGEKLDKDKLSFKRPGTGMQPDKVDQLLGRVAKIDIKKDAQIKIAHLGSQSSNAD